MRKNFYISRHSPLAFILFGLLLIVGSCQDLSEDRSVAELEQVSLMKNEGFIPGKYIVVLQEQNLHLNFRKTDSYEAVQAGMRKFTNELVARYEIQEEKVERVYGNLLSGFSAELTPEQFQALEKDPLVKYIEPDGYVYAISSTQPNATWGLDRIDTRALDLNGNYVYNNTGTGVTAYIIDTGIKRSHNEFRGRAAATGFDAYREDGDVNYGEDCNGHGTHVAGTVGGEEYGVAKETSLVAVRVLDCSGSGTWSGVIAGMDWVTANKKIPGVANMSLGGGSNTAINDAVKRMYDAGIPVIVAAGNGNMGGKEQDACGYSPAGAPSAYTVGATTKTDSKTSWSNYGDCVDIFAPGSGITSAWYTSNTDTKTISGTSMASPHVAGVAALYLETKKSATSQAVYDFLTLTSTKNIVTNSKTTNNHLVYSLGESSGDGGGGTEPEPEPDPDPSGIVLSGNGYKVQGRWAADLSWDKTSTAAGKIDIYRDGTKIKTVDNSGEFTDQTNIRGGGSLTYQICEAGTNVCSNTITLNY